MRQIELHIFFNRGGGVTKWKPELYSEYFGYEAIWAEIHSVSDIFFSICDRSQAFPIFTKIRDLFYSNYAYAAYLTYVSHIQPELAIPSTAKFLLCHHLLAFISCCFSYLRA